MSAVVRDEAFSLRPSRRGPRRWATLHAQAALATLGVIARSPVASALTVAVIAAALALPAALQMVLENIEHASSGLTSHARVTLFLSPEVNDDQARELAARLETRPAVASVLLTDRSAALADYQRMIGLDGLEAMFGDDNPLPAVIDVVPTSVGDLATDTEGLARILGQLSEVEMVRVDLDWISRLQALIALGRRGLLLLAGFLAAAVVLVVGNTLRLAIDDRRDQIGIMRAFGGTDAFIRRPFLYNGAAVGLAGGALAWMIVLVAALNLEGPVARLAAVYGSEYSLRFPGTALGIALTLGGAALGLVGAFVAVGRHLGRVGGR